MEARLTDKRSFYAILVDSATSPDGTMINYTPELPQANKDWKKWEKEQNEEDWRGYGLGYVPGKMDANQVSYHGWLFLRSLTEVSRKRIIGSADWPPEKELGTEPFGDVRSLLREKPSFAVPGPPEDPVSETTARAMLGAAVRSSAEKWDHSKLTASRTDRRTLRLWAQFLINTKEDDAPIVVNGFLRYAHEHGDESIFAEMALSTFISRGYAYNERTGDYAVNGIGKQLLDYAVAHPMPKVLEVCRVLRKHWGDHAMFDLIQDRYPDCKVWDDFEKKVGK